MSIRDDDCGSAVASPGASRLGPERWPGPEVGPGAEVGTGAGVEAGAGFPVATAIATAAAAASTAEMGCCVWATGAVTRGCCWCGLCGAAKAAGTGC